MPHVLKGGVGAALLGTVARQVPRLDAVAQFDVSVCSSCQKQPRVAPHPSMVLPRPWLYSTPKPLWPTVRLCSRAAERLQPVHAAGLIAQLQDSLLATSPESKFSSSNSQLLHAWCLHALSKTTVLVAPARSRCSRDPDAALSSVHGRQGCRCGEQCRGRCIPHVNSLLHTLQDCQACHRRQLDWWFEFQH